MEAGSSGGAVTIRPRSPRSCSRSFREGRPDAPSRPQRGARRAHPRARTRRLLRAADRSRAARRRADRRVEVRLGDRDERRRRARAQAAWVVGAPAACGRDRAGDRRGIRRRRSRRACLDAGGSARRASTPGGTRLVCRRGRLTSPARRGARRGLRSALQDTGAAAVRSDRRRSRRPCVSVCGACVRCAPDRDPFRLDWAADDRGRAGCRRPRRRRSGNTRSRRPRRSRRRGDALTSRAVPAFITFLTDFGLEDDFVGTCHGVMKKIASDVQIIDITHGIAPRQVLQGALTLANTLPYMPVGVHLAVVDPGVGSARRALALRDGEGRIHVGPDNGLLIFAAEKCGGIAEAHELTNPDYALESVSRTFHGRDLFSPAAAHLALGVPLAEIGPPIAPDALARLDLPQPAIGASRIRATVISIDRFGNMQLNLDRAHLEQAGVVPGMRLELALDAERYYATAARTFADARRGDIILYEDAYRNVAIAISNGNAAAMFNAREGQDLRIHLDVP